MLINRLQPLARFVQRVGRGNIPAVIRNLCAGGSHNSFRIGDTGTHIFTGAFKYLFAGYRADRRSINLNIQNKFWFSPLCTTYKKPAAAATGIM